MVRLAMSVDVMSGHSSKLPSAVTRTQWVSDLVGQSDATNLQYDTVQSAGMDVLGTKNIVFVPFFMRVPTP